MAETAGMYAEQYLAAEICVLPIKADGSKAPALPRWDEYKRRLPTLDEVRDWFGDKTLGVAIVGGEVSKHLGVIDVEFDDIFHEFFFLLREELGVIATQLPQVLTPGKSEKQRGRHLYFRSTVKVGTRKLARIGAIEAKERTGDARKTTAIEIKAEGGYVLAPGCPAACHTSGRMYERVGDTPIELVPTLDEEQVRTILRCARMMDRGDTVRVEWGGCEPLAEGEIPNDGTDERPGDEFNRLMTWQDVLSGHDWKIHRKNGNVIYWTRPGKDKGISATTGFCSNGKSGDLLYVFSSNAEPLQDGRAYSKFGAYGILEHGGDFAAAAKAKAMEGMGQPKRKGVKKEKAAAEPKAEEQPQQAVRRIAFQAPFPLHIFPEVLQGFASELAQSFSCPLDFPGIGILGIAGTAIGAARALRITKRWTECPRFYFAIVSDPGSGKTPAINAIAAPLIEEQDRLASLFHIEREQYEEALRDWDKAKAEAKGRKEAAPEKPKPPIFRHLYTNDPTVESLVPMLSENPRGFLFLRDEITAWMLSLNQYKGGKGADRQFWLSQWSGESHKTDRKGTREQGSIIARNPCISVLGGIQPEMIGELCDERGREDGFVHRILFAFPPECKWSEDFDTPYNQVYEDAWKIAVHNLLKLDMHTEDGYHRPHYIHLTDEGRVQAKLWYREHAQERNSGSLDPGLIGPWSKMRSYFFRACLILHTLRVACDEADTQDVDAVSVIRAASFMEYLKSHAKMIYPRLRQRKEDRLAERTVDWIRKRGKPCSARDIVRAHLTERTTDAVSLLKDLADRGYGTLTNEKNPKGKGTIPTFTLHPDDLDDDDFVS